VTPIACITCARRRLRRTNNTHTHTHTHQTQVSCRKQGREQAEKKKKEENRWESIPWVCGGAGLRAAPHCCRQRRASVCALCASILSCSRPDSHTAASQHVNFANAEQRQAKSERKQDTGGNKASYLLLLRRRADGRRAAGGVSAGAGDGRLSAFLLAFLFSLLLLLLLVVCSRRGGGGLSQLHRCSAQLDHRRCGAGGGRRRGGGRSRGGGGSVSGSAGVLTRARRFALTFATSVCSIRRGTRRRACSR
jgi:hypothetical protein